MQQNLKVALFGTLIGTSGVQLFVCLLNFFSSNIIRSVFLQIKASHGLPLANNRNGLAVMQAGLKKLLAG